MKVFKKSLATAAAAIIALSNVCSGNAQPLIGNIDTVTAESYSDEMKYDDYLSYRKFDKNDDGTYDYIVVAICVESAVSVEIPSEIDGLPVTSIGYEAFCMCTGLTSVTIPDSVTSINNYAFFGCNSLESVTIPGGVNFIGRSAFSGCSSLTNVEIPDSVTSVGDSVFCDTPFLEN